MPIREYVREDGTSFERLEKMDQEPLAHCPDTGQPVQRRITGGGFKLAGSGWAKDSYSKKN